MHRRTNGVDAHFVHVRIVSVWRKYLSEKILHYAHSLYQSIYHIMTSTNHGTGTQRTLLLSSLSGMNLSGGRCPLLTPSHNSDRNALADGGDESVLSVSGRVEPSRLAFGAEGRADHAFAGKSGMPARLLNEDLSGSYETEANVDAPSTESSTCGWEIVKTVIVHLGSIHGDAEGRARSLRNLLKRMATRAESAAALAERSAYHLANRTGVNDQGGADRAGSAAYKSVRAQYGFSLRRALMDIEALGTGDKLLDAQRWQELKRSIARDAVRIDREWQTGLAHSKTINMTHGISLSM
jgi:hypothetical protein